MPVQTFTVSQLNNFIKRVFDTNSILRRVSVEGEISNLTRASSGHYYFSLKDSTSEIRCILWNSTANRLKFKPEDGIAVKASGSVEVYAQRGTYSIIVSSLQSAGVGSLYMIYLNLLKELKEKGWLEEEIKKELPQDIKTVGVVTSETGAVIHDIITTINRRNPLLNILLVPAMVQGEGAAESIAEGIRQLNEEGSADVIIVGRGGGSIEDLWAFNEPIVAQAIHESEIPIISAVGHETDVTVADYVADLRAPTPTAAGEFVSTGLMQIASELDYYDNRLKNLIVQKFNNVSRILERLENRLALVSPESQLIHYQYRVDELEFRLIHLENARLNNYKNKLATLKNSLELLNPKFMFEKGYSMITNKDGEIIRTKEAAIKSKELVLHFSDGNIEATVEEN